MTTDPWQSAGPRRGTGARKPHQADTGENESTATLFADDGTPNPDLDAGRLARDEGRRRAELATLPQVRTALDRAIRDLAATGRAFSSDEVRELVEPIGSSPNSISAAIAKALRAGTISRVGFVQSRREAARGRWIGQYVGGGS